METKTVTEICWCVVLCIMILCGTFLIYSQGVCG